MAARGHEVLANRRLSLDFDRKTGMLAQITNRETGGRYLQEPPAGGNLFAVYHDFSGLFDITGTGAGTPRVATDPRDITRSVFTPGTAATVRFRRSGSAISTRLSILYRAERWRATLALTLRGDSPAVRCSLSVTNTDRVPATCMAVFPFLSGIRLGNGKRNLMVVNDQAGTIRPLWCEQDGGIYGNGYRMSMQWGCAFDDESRQALGFIVLDSSLRPKDIRYRRPSIEVRYFPPLTLAPGGTTRFPDAELVVSTGDWKPIAERYHRWFTSALRPVRHSRWVREIDSHLGQWFGKRRRPGPLERPNALENRLWSFADLPEVYRELPVDVIEFAFHCEGSVSRRVHTDGDNVLRKDLGGAAALRRGVRGVHRLGLHFTFYVEGYIVPFDAQIVARRGAGAWAVMNRDGTNLGNYSRNGWLQMCPGCEEWQEHLARTAARLVRETGADGVRLDSLGTYFFPCYNPAHRHRSPFDFNLWIDELLAKVARSVRSVRRDCLLTTEAPVDFYARHFDGALTQQAIDTAQISVTRDVAPMRVALPEYAVFPHNPCGPIASSLMGYPGGDGGIDPGGRFSDLAERWRCVRYAAAEVLSWGNAAHDNPRASRTDVECRRFSGPGMDVIVGARVEKDRDPAAYRGRQHAWMYLNGDVDLLPDRVRYSVSLDTGGRRPDAAYLYDVETLAVRPAGPLFDGFVARMRLTERWFMAVFCYGKSPAAVTVRAPDAVQAGESCSLALDSLGGRASGSRVRISIPGWGIDASARAPGEARLRVPRTAGPGKYVCTVSGAGTLGCRRFLGVEG